MYKKSHDKYVISILAILIVVMMGVSIPACAVPKLSKSSMTAQAIEKDIVVKENPQLTDEVEPVATAAAETMEKFVNIPLYNQKAYVDVPYGNYGTIASHGCGIACIAMVATYLTDEYHSVKDLAERFGHYNTANGSLWSIFEETAIVLGLDKPYQTYDWSDVKYAVQRGNPVVALMNTGMFSTTRHFVVIAGVTEDGKYIINDPNGDNWFKDEVMIEGFANGFTEEQVKSNGVTYWIYGVKQVNSNPV